MLKEMISDSIRDSDRVQIAYDKDIISHPSAPSYMSGR